MTTSLRLTLSSDLSTYGQYSGDESPAAWKATADEAIVSYLEGRGFEVERTSDEIRQALIIIGDDGLPVETAKAEQQATDLLNGAWEAACGI